MQFESDTRNPCSHTGNAVKGGLALIAIGNTQRRDDGVAAAVCDRLPKSAMTGVCRFDLGAHTGYLSQCLSGHSAAIIVDSTQNGTTPGTVSVMDLTTLLDRATPLNISACHGFSLADELRLARKEHHLPARLIFFGVEVPEVSWTENLSPTLQSQLTRVSQSLSPMIVKIVESLNRHE